MKFAYTRLVTEDVPKLAAFYEKLLATPSAGSDDYVELRPGGAILALVSRKACGFMHGGDWVAASNQSAILEFQVDDVDRERDRIGGLVTDWLQQPKDMPWGNRSMLFRDPDGNTINFFRPPVADR
ncbi:VOC family protein [Nitrospirillum sp. BR 11164]|uniref:VOC family protein n=1 Tax=Nitrospirillum sp. BR 11164 TaxID=3104324 RepID=UPI002AFE94F2|nr:VOC family protein [Nitrospirillum sp. BR 11164]MEA1650356.1 VOC family protein [Nitrospirillum sp. BR 11164]